MNIDDFIFWSQDLPELENSAGMKKAIGTTLITLCTLNDPDNAILAACSQIIATFKENILPTTDFIKHPANRISAFSSEAEWLASYMRFLLKKADNMTTIGYEKERGHSKVMRIIDADDPGVCRGCTEHKQNAFGISEVSYDDIPPFHFGCRCSFLLLK